jgi:hypothetical protein
VVDATYAQRFRFVTGDWVSKNVKEEADSLGTEDAASDATSTTVPGQLVLDEQQLRPIQILGLVTR